VAETTGKGKNDSKAEARQVGELLGRFDRYWQNIRPRIAAWKEYYKVIQFFRSVGPRSYKYNYSFPISFAFTENFVASIMNPLFASNQTVEVEPRESFSYLYGLGINDEELSRQLDRALRYFLDGPDSYFYESFEDAVRSAAYYGTEIDITLPAFGTITDPDQFIGPRVEAVELWDAVLAPGVRQLRPGTEFFMREIVTRAELERRARVNNYRKVEKVFDAPKHGDDDIHSQILSEMGLEGLGEMDEQSKRDPNTRVLLIHHYDVEGNVIIIAGGRQMVYNSKWPATVHLADGTPISFEQKPFDYYPFHSIRMGQGPKDFYGIGFGQLTKQVQDSINIRHSQKTQAGEMAVFNPILYNMKHDIDLRKLYTGPGHVIPVNNLEDTIKIIELGRIPPELFQMDQQEWRYGEEASGSQSIGRGINPGNRVTATGSTQLLQSSQQRFNMTGTKFARMQAAAARKTIVQIPRYMSKRDYERIIGEPDAGLYALPVEDIVAAYDFRPRIPALTGPQREQRFTLMNQLLTTIAPLGVANVGNFVYEIVREMFPDRDPNKFLLPELVQQSRNLGMIVQQLQQSGALEPPGAVPAEGSSPPGTYGNYKTEDQIMNAAESGGQA